MFHRKAAAPKSPKVKRVIFKNIGKIRENQVKTIGKCLIPSKTAGQQPSTLAKKRQHLAVAASVTTK